MVRLPAEPGNPEDPHIDVRAGPAAATRAALAQADAPVESPRRHQIPQALRDGRRVESTLAPAAADGKRDRARLARANGDDEPAEPPWAIPP